MFRASAMFWSFADRTCMSIAGMSLRLNGAAWLSDTEKRICNINIFNFHLLLAARTWLVIFPTYRNRKNYKPCSFPYKPPAKSCHRDGFGRKRGFLYEKRTAFAVLPYFRTTKIIHFSPKSKLC